MRLSDEEYQSLSEYAADHGWSISNAIRRLILNRNSAQLLPLQGKISPQNRYAILKKNNDNIEKLFQKIDILLTNYRESITIKNRFGNPAINTEQTTRIFRSFEYYLKEIIKDQNEILVSFGKEASNLKLPDLPADPVHEGGSGGLRVDGVSSSDTPEAQGSVDFNKVPLINKYMWKSTLVGTVTSVPVEVLAENKVSKLIRFKMSVQEYIHGQKNEYLFIVEAAKKDVYLQKISIGSKLTVFGTQAIIVEKTRMGEAGQLYVFADNIVLP